MTTVPEGARRPGGGRVVLYDDGPLGPDEPWVFGRDDDGNNVTLGPPPKIVCMSRELVDGTEELPVSLTHSPVTRRGRLVRVVVTNCRAVYRVAAWDPGNETYVCRLARVFAYFPVPNPTE